jgi:hypothetical protein
MDQLFSSIMNSTSTKTPTTPNTSADANNLLSKQMLTSNKINDLIDNAAKMVFCGPGSACQKQQVTDALQKKYLDAQVNVQVAPLQLETTKKNYYVYKEGRPYYNDLIEKELSQKVTAIANMITEKFNEEIVNANIMNSYYNTIQINSENTIELYKEYLKKNKLLDELIKGSHGDVLTNDRKTYYETEALDRLKSWHTFLISLYFILLIVFVFTLFYYPNDMSRKKQIFIIILFIIYPFVIHKIVETLYNYYTKSVIKNTETNIYMDL